MKKQLGISLIELLITLTIISILTMITIPGLHELMQQAQDNAVKDEILRLIKVANNEAQLQKKSVTICHSSNLRSCRGDWSQGQIVFVDIAGDGEVHHQNQIITVNQMQSGRGRMRIRFYPFYRTYLQFHPLREENNDNGKIWYCRNQSSLPVWAIDVSQSGETHVTLPDDTGKINDSSGNALTC